MAPVSSDVWREQQDFVSAALDSLRKCVVLTDVTLVCGNKEFFAHRLLLCATSPYFLAMFQSGMKEAGTGRVELNSVSAESLEAVLEFIYNGAVFDADVCTDKLQDLLQTTHLLQIPVLFAHCLKHLTRKLSADYFLPILHFVEFYSEDSLVETLYKYLAINFCRVSASPEFLNLSFAQLERVLQHPDLQPIGPVDTIVERIISWVEFSKEERETHLKLLLGHVDLDRISAFVNLTPIIKGDEDVCDHLVPKILAKREKQRPRNLLLCFGTDTTNRMVTPFDLDSRIWLPSRSMPFPMQRGMAVAEQDGNVYFAGSEENYTPGPLVYKYDYVTNTAQRIATLTNSVSQAGLGILHGLIYVVGGKTTEGYSTVALRTVQRVNPKSGTCEVLASTQDVHVRPLVFSHVDDLYAIGSVDDSQAALEKYSVEFDQWTEVTRIPRPVNWCSATLAQGKVFVVRASNETSLDIYDLETDSWEERSFSREHISVLGLWSNGGDELLIRTLYDCLCICNVGTLALKQLPVKNNNPWYGALTVVAQIG